MMRLLNVRTNGTRSGVLQIRREQPEQAVAEPGGERLPGRARGNADGMIARGEDIARELRAYGFAVYLHGDLEVQPEAPRVDVGRADLRVAAVDDEQLR